MLQCEFYKLSDGRFTIVDKEKVEVGDLCSNEYENGIVTYSDDALVMIKLDQNNTHIVCDFNLSKLALVCSRAVSLLSST